ncbi:TRAP transporter substrate-binding protein [Thermodesulfobacteriota bacterium]
MLFKKRVGILMIFILSVVFLSGTAGAKTYEWRLGSIFPAKSPIGEQMALLVKKVEQKTNGKMKIKIGYSSAFGGLKELVPALSMGSIQMFITGHNWWDTIDKNRKIFTFPYTFSDWDHLTAFIKSSSWQDMLKKLDAQNTHMIFPDAKAEKVVLWKRGPNRVLLSKKPVFTAKDLEGLKLRLYESELAKRVWRHMGCNITVVAWAEAYLALKQGMVEAITAPRNLCYGMKFYEVAPYITDINEFLQAECVVVNKPAWEKLPPNIKKAIMVSITEVATKANENLYSRAEADLKKMMDEGAFYIRTSLKSFKKKILPLAKELESEGMWRKGLFDEIQQLKK